MNLRPSKVPQSLAARKSDKEKIFGVMEIERTTIMVDNSRVASNGELNRSDTKVSAH